MQSRLERVEKILDKMEALEKYPDVKDQFDKTRKENEALKEQLDKARNDLSNCEARRVKFDGREVSLKEVEEQQLALVRKLYAEEIQRKAQEKFKVEAPQLTKNELEKLLKLPFSGRPRVLNEILTKSIHEGVKQNLQSESLWPQWFKTQVQAKIDNGVNDGLNQIYYADVKKGVQDAKDKEWPKYVENVITPYLQDLLLSRFVTDMDGQQITVSCKICQITDVYTLNREDIAILLAEKSIATYCSDMACQEGWLNRHPTITDVSLGEVFLQIITNINRP